MQENKQPQEEQKADYIPGILVIIIFILIVIYA